MIRSAFALGESYGFYFESPAGQAYYRLPQGLQILINNGTISNIYSIVFGTGLSYFVSYRTSNGQARIATSVNLPTKLYEWLNQRDGKNIGIRRPRTLHVTLGYKNLSWYASDGGSFAWHNLPPALNALLTAIRSSDGQHWIQCPRIIALGYEGDYVLVTDTGAASWRLKNYPALNKMLEKLKQKGMHFDHIKKIVLDAFREHCCLMQYSNGSISRFGMSETAKAAIHNIEGSCIDDVKKQQASDEDVKQLDTSIKLIRQVCEEASIEIAKEKQAKEEKRKKMIKFATRTAVVVVGIALTGVALDGFQAALDPSEVFSSVDTATPGGLDVGSNIGDVSGVSNLGDIAGGAGAGGADANLLQSMQFANSNAFWGPLQGVSSMNATM